ncbi:response regulator [Rhodoblastus sp.]|jgi:two-component system OmpR family response regulator|uniref:response regulator n=1 Tax=Rhodoblastus sp. TaxID=1962975 RepID=UPI0025E608B1|nr:response regulator [Rhodoblastus sp.]
MRVLLVEDDLMLGKALVRGLADQSMVVDWVKDGEIASAALAHPEHAIVLLDLGLPLLSGLNVLKQARAAGTAIPIIIITAQDSVDDRVAGLDLGADDYIVKPFDLSELLARIRAVLRRHNGQAQSRMSSGEITLDLATHVAAYRGMEEMLSAREFALLRALMERPGAILSRAQIEERIYGWGEEVESNAIDFLIHVIRKKFDRDIVRNIRGAGWMVVKDQP